MPVTPSLVLIDGEESDGRISVFDDGLLRGDGCFEAIRSQGGRLFALDLHLLRLAASADALQIPVPPSGDLIRWIETVAAAGGDCMIRVLLTRGATLPTHEAPGRCIVLSYPVPPIPAGLSLLPVPAPWHAAGRAWELSGAKTISYAPNQAATRTAQRAGFDDSLLITDTGVVLEGPTFSFAWVVDEVVETAALDMGILDSITRRLMLDDCRDLGIEVRQGRFDLGRVREASEVLAISTVRRVAPVIRVGEWTYSAGEIGARLKEALFQRAQAMAPQFTTGR